MPRIPVYQQQVQPEAMPTVRRSVQYTPNAFGAPQAQAIGNIAEVADNATNQLAAQAEIIRKKKEAIWVQERLGKLAQQYDTYTYGTPDGQVQGVLNSKGLAAAKAAEGANEQLDQIINDMMTDAPSPDAVNEFRVRALAVRTGTSSTIARHAATEVNNYHSEAALGNANIQAEAIAADYNQSPESIDQQFMERVAPSISEAARLRGKPQDEAIRDAKAGLYQQIITQSLAEGNTKRASDLLSRWTDDIDAKTRASLTDKIRTERIASDSLNIATSMLDKGLGEQAAKKYVDETYGDDVHMRDAVWTRYRQEQSFRKQASEESKKAQYGSLLKNIFTEKDPRVRVEMAMRANPEFFQGALSFADSLNKPPADTPELKEAAKRYDAQINAELRRMVDAGLFTSEHEIYAKAAEMNVREIGNIGDSVTYWKGGGGGLKDSEVRTMFKEMTGDDASKSPDKFAAVYDYISTFAPKAEGRQVPPEIVRKLMSESLLSWDPGVLSSEKTNAEWLSRNKQKLDEFKGSDLYEFKPEIPPATRAEIEKYLRANNKDSSLSSVRKYYIHKFMGVPVQQQGGL